MKNLFVVSDLLLKWKWDIWPQKIVYSASIQCQNREFPHENSNRQLRKDTNHFDRWLNLERNFYDDKVNLIKFISFIIQKLWVCHLESTTDRNFRRYYDSSGRSTNWQSHIDSFCYLLKKDEVIVSEKFWFFEVW